MRTHKEQEKTRDTSHPYQHFFFRLREKPLHSTRTTHFPQKNEMIIMCMCKMIIIYVITSGKRQSRILRWLSCD